MILSVSLLIPTMNRPETLARTLKSYFSADSIPSQVVVVDQSGDNQMRKRNQTILEEYCSAAETKYVFQEVPSLTMARNNAARHASEDIVVFSDDDVDVYKDTLENVYEIMSDKSVSMIAGIDDNTPPAKTDLGYLCGTKSFAKRKIGHVTKSMLGRYPDCIDGQIETQWAMGYFFVMRKSLLEKWNVQCDEKMTGYAYAEDLDYSYSYYKHSVSEKMRCVLDSRVHVKHMVSQEYRIPSSSATYKYVINRVYLSYKHKMGAGSRLAIFWSDIWMLAFKILKKEAPKDMVNAIIRGFKVRSDLKKGIILEEFYR